MDLLAIYLTTNLESDNDFQKVKRSFGDSLPPNVHWNFVVLSATDFPDITQALNKGIQVAIDNDFEFVTWVHSDMVYDDHTWFPTLKHYLDTYSSITKICASNSRDPIQPTRIGQEQTWLMRTSDFKRKKRPLWFNPNFIRCGGYEDWLQTFQILGSGNLVMITDQGTIFHAGAQTRSRYDTTQHQLRNHDTYLRLTGFGEALDPHSKRFVGLFLPEDEIPGLYESLNNDFPFLELSVDEHFQFRRWLVENHGWNYLRYLRSL